MSQEPDSPNLIPLQSIDPRGAGGLPRRSLLQALMASAAAGLALPSTAAAQHPMLHHLESATLVEQAQAAAAAAGYEPVFLDAHQLRTLEALAEAIVPGSTTAKVAPFLDQLLAVEASLTQRDFLGSLGAFDMAALDRYRKPWLDLGGDEQAALLQQVSTADAKSLPRHHFENVKTWVAGAYYSSEPGMRELGWTGGVFHAELPGCTHADGHG